MGKFKKVLVEGSFQKFTDSPSEQVLISQVIANRLSVGVGDQISAFFQNSISQNIPNIRRFKVTGLFSSGFLISIITSYLEI